MIVYHSDGRLVLYINNYRRSSSCYPTTSNLTGCEAFREPGSAYGTFKLKMGAFRHAYNITVLGIDVDAQKENVGSFVYYA